MNQTTPIDKDIVLVGGGHSHALVIRSWAMNPIAGVRLTLISRDVLTPYSGMLPGFVAGHYSHDDIHIDLLRLCAWGGIRFIAAEMTAIDLEAQQVQLRDRPAIGYDILSLDTGSTPQLGIPGAQNYATPVKPVHSFVERWHGVLERANNDIGVVGAGAGGFELVTAMAHRLRHESASIHWFIRGEMPLSERPPSVGQQALQRALALGINVHTGYDVERVSEDGVHAADGREVLLDELLWCTAASAPAWPKESGLQTDERGFVATTASLQSCSHANVFATGDIGTQVQTPSAKAGVFAVRQAPVLLHNLIAMVRNQPLRNYVPQRNFLTLISTGAQHAIGNRGRFTVAGAWVWRWKHHIDVTFMNKFHHLPVMTRSAKTSKDETSVMRCNGCGAKVPAQVLNDVLAQLPRANVDHVDIERGFGDAADAAVIAWPSNRLVQSVDQIRALVDDPYRFGRIAALHALSDVYTENARAHSAQVLITMPYASATIVQRELQQLMLGINAVLHNENCALIGGHTAEGAELQVGLVVNAEWQTGHQAHNEKVAVKQGERYALILTQALGIGVLFAGLMQEKTRGVDIEHALVEMSRSNREAATIFSNHGMVCCTDVTGFGLLGHLHNLALRHSMQCQVRASAVPLLTGVEALLQQNVQSTLSEANQTVLLQLANAQVLTNEQKVVLTDPQTSGGLLALVPESKAVNCIAALQQNGYKSAANIGITEASGHASIELLS